ncbi:MAG: ABC transporter permease [Planctomycetes bacterium]|nr:ABC transporter permease [Planctomycetota bacterium]
MYKILLCLRYLRTRYIALASIISVMLGVATMIVVNSVMAGFSTEMRDRIHGILADVIIETHSLEGVPDAEWHMEIARRAAGDQIEAMTATVEVYGMLSFEYGGEFITRPVTLIGINPAEKAVVSPLVAYLDSFNEITELDPDTGKKRVIRPALRSRDVAPGWELTETARERRKILTERDLQFLDHLNHGIDAADDFVPPERFRIPPETNEEQTSKAENPASEESESAIQQVNQTVEAPNFDTEPSTAIENSEVPNFPGGGESTGFTKATPEDPAAPLKGRLYVGIGLVTIHDTHRVTKKPISIHMVRPGDDVRISTVTAGQPPDAVHFKATVVDLFKSGMSEYDSNLVFCNLEFLQEMRGMFKPETGQIDPLTGDVDPATCVKSITSIQIKLKDYAQAPEVVERLKAAFPPGVFRVRTWEERQGPLLAAVEVESAILNVLLFLIIAVAGFGILAIFYMIVVEKTRDIGILKALGASSRGVMSIFLSYGLTLGIVGSGIGVGLGLLFVHYINTIDDWISWMTGKDIFDPRIYYFEEIPTYVNPVMVFWVAFGAMTIAVLASILPALRAAKLHPVDALRYE